MAVVGVTQWRIKPGRMAQFVQACAHAKKIHERLGARNVRLLEATYAGTNAMLLSYVVEFEDFAAQGAFSQKLTQDAEWQKLWEGAGNDPSGEIVSNAILSEVNLGA